MERTPTTMLRIGAWCVNPASGQISREGESARLEARTMRLLLCLAEHPGEVVSIDDLLNQVWSGVVVGVSGHCVATQASWRRPETACLYCHGAEARLSNGGNGEPMGRGAGRTAGRADNISNLFKK